jgi:septal ring factor EnvC (AmiA/AmiB activator)
MNDAITAANIITDAMAANQFAALVSTARARRDYEGEIAHLRAWLQHYERQQAVLASAATEAIKIAKDYETTIARLEGENQQLRNQNAELSAGKKAAEDRAQAEGRRLVHWELYGAPPPNDSR